MSREKALAKNTVILTFGKLCTQFVSFLLLPLYTAILEPEVYGIADLFNSYIFLIVPLVSLMLDQGLFRFLLECRGEPKREKELFSTVVCINVLGVIAYAIFYFLIKDLIHSQYRIFIFIDVVINIFLNTCMQYARGVGKNGVYSFTSFLSASLIVVLNVVTLVLLKMGAWGLFISTIVGRFIALIAIIILQKSWKLFSIRAFSKKEAKELLRYSIPFIPNQLSWWVVGVSDRTIISWILSVAANGLYSVANKFSSIYIAFYNIFNLSWTESVSLHIGDDDAEDFLGKTINTMFSLFYSVCIGIIAYVPILFPFLINKQYSEAYPHVPILMLAVLFQVIVGLYSVIYVALKKSKEIAKTSVFAAIINIGVDIALIKLIGLYAASVSTLVAYLTMAIYRYFHIKRYADVPLKHKLSYTLIAIIVCVSYYINNSVVNIIMASAVTVYAILSNKEFVASILNMTKSRVRTIIERKKNK